MRLFTVMALAGLVAFTSCSVSDDIQDDGGDGAVRFTSGIRQVATPEVPGGTRAAGVTWGLGDHIGVFMMQGTTALAANRDFQVTHQAQGRFEAVAGHEMYYPMDNSEVSFIAYYPYSTTPAALTTALPVKIETAQTTDNQPLFDLLYSTGATGSKSTTGHDPVKLSFDHMLAKLVLDCKAAPNLEGTDVLTGMKVTITGMNTVSTFNLADGTLGDTPEIPAEITPRTITDAEKYDAIILPGTYTDPVTVKFEMPATNHVYTWTLTSEQAKFEGGKEYTYAVTITRTGVEVKGEIKPWTVETGGDVVAE